MCSTMFSAFASPVWGGGMMIGMFLIGALTIVALVLSIVYLLKLIRK